MKKKVLLSSILVIALCLCLIAGSTFALFTSKSGANIVVSAGNVEMVAGLEITQVASVEGDTAGTITDMNGNTYSYSYVDAEAPYDFINGGTAEMKDGVLTLTNITPGDKVTFQITGTNNSDVAVKYRYTINCTNGNKLMSGLTISVNGNETDSTASYISAWDSLGAEQDMAPVTVSIELPVTAGDDYQEETTYIQVIVEAVQSNAAIENVTYVSNDKQLRDALHEGGKVVLTSDIEIGTTREWESQGNYSSIYMKDVGEVVLDLNGHTLTTADAGACMFATRGDTTLTITGNGKVMIDYAMVVPFNGSTVIIENGTFLRTDSAKDDANTMLIGTTGSTVIVNGGYFDDSNMYYNPFYLSGTQKITIYGGTFVEYNPTNGDYWKRGFLLEGQTEFGKTPDGYTITNGTTADGETTYTVTYNG